MNRVESLIFQGNPTYNMSVLLSALGDSTIVPRPNKYYTFVYKAKTPRIQYDQHPLIQCGSIFPWGFTGLNSHMGARQYTWAEVSSNLYELSEEEFAYLQDVPLALIKST